MTRVLCAAVFLLGACAAKPEATSPPWLPVAGNAALPMAGGTANAVAGGPAVAAGSGGGAGTAGMLAPVPQPDMQPVSGAMAADAGQAGTAAATDAGSPEPQLAVSADFLNRTLSIVDVDRLRPGGTRADALIGTVDLSMYSPGPLSLAITPDGRTALVSISAGFLGAFISVPPGAGMLLFVDLETRAVTGELDVGNSPMGIVVSQDGKRAFVGLYSESYFAVVDIEQRTFEPVSTGSSFNEELAIDDTGTVAILTYGPAGNARTFSVADPAGSLGQTRGLSGDAAGVAFFPGTKLAYLMQAPTVLTGNVGGHDVIDVTNPSTPVAMDGARIGSHPTTYPVTAVAARNSVAFNSTEDGMLSLVEVKLEAGSAREAQRVTVGPAASLAYGLSATRDGRVLVSVSGEHYVGVVDLETGTAFTVPWEVTMSGPTEIKALP